MPTAPHGAIARGRTGRKGTNSGEQAMKVVLHNDAGQQTAQRLASLATDGIEVAVCDGRDGARFAALMAEAEVLWHMFEPVTAALMATAPRLKLVQRLGVGLDLIDLAAARARGIAVANTPGANAPAVAEMALTLMLGALRRLSLLDRTTRSGSWAIDPVIQRQMGGSAVARSASSATVRSPPVWRRCSPPWARAFSTPLVRQRRRREPSGAVCPTCSRKQTSSPCTCR